MTAQLLDGKKVAQKIHQQTLQQVKQLKEKGVTPSILFIRVGEDPASQIYVSMKDKKAAELAIFTQTHILPDSVSEKEIFSLIQQSNSDPKIHGILLQSPLPSHLNEQTFFSAIAPQKDVDGFHPENMGKLLLGDFSGFIPCTPAGIHRLLIEYKIPIEGANVALLGRGNIVGKPIAALLMQKAKDCNATVTVLHSHSKNIPEICQHADILIAAMGKPHFIKAEMVKPGATVIDVGVSRDPATHRIVGDVDFEAVQQAASFITPNPGGVGPMTIAMLMANVVRACEKLTSKI
ncbi:MAG: bifunctional 5,10-methylenetetrahydrofolate dehydrogenase/5,10-methenyltetrahydrofolate cyclohydrolase [Verrucomicrobiae bacterium]|nr:bifunctional 5,10-methylenetetrahydrofolate dehydrogenase/5,10-methenyltetrahydrofolate cyclohydrolase [Verrucomicrobiae bacterium]